jgi:endogenous inhibitor of DNA gyrase (YacG/DUF329 family)
MTDTQRNEIQRLRQAGFGYVRISQTLKLPVNTVKSFCQRNPVRDTAAVSGSVRNVCPQCGALLPTNAERRPRRFCSDQCRSHYWTEHQEEIVRKSAVASICAACGTRFSDYANRARKYCCHACYILGRYKGGKTRG